MEKPSVPIESNELEELLIFDHVDGMYSYCRNLNTKVVVHPAAWTEVMIVGKYEDNK
jgi:hypothetical protein